MLSRPQMNLVSLSMDSMNCWNAQSRKIGLNVSCALGARFCCRRRKEPELNVAASRRIPSHPTFCQQGKTLIDCWTQTKRMFFFCFQPILSQRVKTMSRQRGNARGSSVSKFYLKLRIDESWKIVSRQRLISLRMQLFWSFHLWMLKWNQITSELWCKLKA